jgi:hypothetical protein
MKSRVARARAELNRLLDTEQDPQTIAKRNAALRNRARNDTSAPAKPTPGKRRAV